MAVPKAEYLVARTVEHWAVSKADYWAAHWAVQTVAAMVARRAGYSAALKG
jgi:hypothetical protein